MILLLGVPELMVMILYLKITGTFLLREGRCQYTLANVKQHHLQYKEPNFHEYFH